MQDQPITEFVQENKRTPSSTNAQHQPIRGFVTRDAAAVGDVEITIPLPVPEFQGQGPISNDLENEMRNAHSKMPPLVRNMRGMSALDIYLCVKRLASFINVNRIRGSSLQTLSGILLNELESDDQAQPSTYGTLWLISGGSQYSDVVNDTDTKADAGLYQCLTNYFLLCLYDRNNNIPRHKCSRKECSTYCILPIYARRILPDRTVNYIFCRIKQIIQRYPRLISRDDNIETRERDSAANLLKHIALDCETSDILREGFDTLYAMSGENQTIFDYNSKVDSRLYELIFDELRQFDYQQTSPQRLQTMPKWSVPFLTTDASIHLRRDISEYIRIAQERYETATPAYPGTEGGGLPSYDSVKSRRNAQQINKAIKHNDNHSDNDNNEQLVTNAKDGIPNVIITPPTPTTEDLPPGPTLCREDDLNLPTYEQVLAGITENHEGEQSF